LVSGEGVAEAGTWNNPPAYPPIPDAAVTSPSRAAPLPPGTSQDGQGRSARQVNALHLPAGRSRWIYCRTKRIISAFCSGERRQRCIPASGPTMRFSVAEAKGAVRRRAINAMPPLAIHHELAAFGRIDLQRNARSSEGGWRKWRRPNRTSAPSRAQPAGAQGNLRPRR